MADHDENRLEGFEAARRLYAVLGEPDVEAAGAGASSVDPYPKIDRYTIESVLGRGRSGCVYRARMEGSERPIALKLMNRQLGSVTGAGGVDRAWRELHLLSQVRLPSVPRLLDYGEHGGRLFFVTELVDGRPLDEHCDHEQLNRRARVSLLAQVAHAVQSLHQFGIIHRDIKPGNILVDCHGQAMVIDLGIALLLDDDVMQTLTADGAPIGSPAFMSPEQARGERRSISTATDVYGLGATALYILTGRTPHDTQTTLHEAVRRVAQDAPRHPSAVDPSLPKPVAAVLAKACSQSADRRYASAAAFGMDLTRWLDHEPVEAGGQTAYQRLGRFIGRRPIAATFAASVSIAVSVLLFTWVSVWWYNAQPYTMHISPDQSTAILVARSGRVLREWVGDARWPVAVATILKPDSSFGEPRILLGYFARLDDERRGALQCLDLEDPDEVLWSTGTTCAWFNMPEAISRVGPGSMRIYSMIEANVFEESPGDEIVAIYRHNPYSPSLVRVHDPNGKTLFEFWHDGHIAKAYWHEASGSLICCGVNSEAVWMDRGELGATRRPYPRVVFAVKPEFGVLRSEWIHTAGGAGTYEPVWYQCVLPAAEENMFSVHDPMMFVEPPGEYDPSGRQISFTMQSRDEHRATLRFMIDPQTGGRVECYASASYLAQKSLPEYEIFTLGALPAISREVEAEE